MSKHLAIGLAVLGALCAVSAFEPAFASLSTIPGRGRIKEEFSQVISGAATVGFTDVIDVPTNRELVITDVIYSTVASGSNALSLFESTATTDTMRVHPIFLEANGHEHLSFGTGLVLPGGTTLRLGTSGVTGNPNATFLGYFRKL